MDNIDQARQGSGASQNIFSPLSHNNPMSPQPQQHAKSFLNHNLH